MITVLSDNVETWDLYKQLLTNATKSIELTMWYAFVDDYIKIVEDLLLQALARGVSVKITYPNERIQELQQIVANGNNPDVLYTGIFIENLKKAGAEVINFTLEVPGRGSHRKILVIDDTKMIIGGRNIKNSYYENTDTSYIDCDILVDCSNGDQPMEIIEFIPTKRTQKIFDFPKYNKNNNINKYIELINDAKESIVIANFSSLYTKKIRKALVKALKRKVQITLYINVQKQLGYFLGQVDFLNYMLKYKNFNLFTNDSNRLLHMKIAVFDNKISVIGSFNFDEDSYTKNAEVIAIVDNETTANEFITFTQSFSDQYFSKVTEPLDSEDNKLITAIMQIILIISY
ncbi:MAG: hypothetical protein Terrestrivirus1_255 [Terrestrivirus sp.]|uniref:PLD phosphodiesterase domain-containing protein n=1 Tax=Terrestrivirus sp. TaxID=2487775 RepID=A0A3G4ZMV1_9VIRU|nr:MAG: hypothetical protein Terrestrivirus1_255 [Terrestrivirus sp.]